MSDTTIDTTKGTRSTVQIIKHIYARYGILLILLFMIVLSSILSPVFLTERNLINVIRQMSIIYIIGCGVTMVIITAGIDLSSGSVAALSGVMACSIMVRTGSIPIAILGGIVVGGLTGLVSGWLITKFDLPPFITTLAMMTAARGLVLFYTNGVPVAGIGNLKYLGQGAVGKIPIPIIIMLIVFSLIWLLLNRMKVGRYMYATGGNEEAAVASGINVKKVKIFTYLINGMLVGLAGVILMARINSGQPAAGLMYELDAITCAVLGGTSLTTGGIGTVQGTLAGAMIIGILNNILNLTNVSPYYQQMLKGVIIVAAVVLDMKTKAMKSGD